MSDEPIFERFRVLSPTEGQVRRLEGRVVSGWDARDKSLWREWVQLFQRAPLLHSAMMLVAALVIGLGVLVPALVGLGGTALGGSPQASRAASSQTRFAKRVAPTPTEAPAVIARVR